MAVLDEQQLENDINDDVTEDLSLVKNKADTTLKKVNEVLKKTKHLSSIQRDLASLKKTVDDLDAYIKLMGGNFDAMFQCLNQLINNQAVIAQTLAKSSGEKKKGRETVFSTKR